MTADTLTKVLQETSSAVESGDLAAAHRAFKLAGCGESFFTKWLWSVSLGNPDSSLRPLILDLRVRKTLGLVLGTVEGWRGLRGSNGYAQYVSLIHETASQLKANFENLDGEKVEWLLFDRPPRGGHDEGPEACLVKWLTELAGELEADTKET